MAKCKFTEKEDGNTIQKPEIISSMNLVLEQSPEPDLYYNVKFIPNKSGNNMVKLSATIGKEGVEPITIDQDLDLYADKSETRLSAKHSLRAIIDKMLNIYTQVSQQPIQRRSHILSQTARYNDLFRNVRYHIMGLSMMKGIGDWGQEIHVLTKNGGVDENSQSPEVRSINNNSDELRMGLTGDQVSASRMIFMRLFANNINDDTIVGYQRKNSPKKNILISDKSFIDVLNRKQSIKRHHSINRKLPNVQPLILPQPPIIQNTQPNKNKVVKANRQVKNTTNKKKRSLRELDDPYILSEIERNRRGGATKKKKKVLKKKQTKRTKTKKKQSK